MVVDKPRVDKLEYTMLRRFGGANVSIERKTGSG